MSTIYQVKVVRIDVDELAVVFDELAVVIDFDYNLGEPLLRNRKENFSFASNVTGADDLFTDPVNINWKVDRKVHVPIPVAVRKITSGSWMR